MIAKCMLFLSWFVSSAAGIGRYCYSSDGLETWSKFCATSCCDHECCPPDPRLPYIYVGGAVGFFALISMAVCLGAFCCRRKRGTPENRDMPMVRNNGPGTSGDASQGLPNHLSVIFTPTAQPAGGYSRPVPDKFEAHPRVQLKNYI